MRKPPAPEQEQARHDPAAPTGDRVGGDQAELVRQAQRLYLRYATEIVEHYHFCPFARAARKLQSMQLRVLLGQAPGPAALSAALQPLPAAQVEVLLLLLPEYRGRPADLRQLAAHVRELDLLQGAWAVADFHPLATLDLRSSDRAVPFIRSTPDPTLQLLRYQSLHAVEQARPRVPDGTRCIDPAELWQVTQQAQPLRTQIAAENLSTLRRIGAAQIQARVQDILEDRRQTYARLGVAPPPWETIP